MFLLLFISLQLEEPLQLPWIILQSLHLSLSILLFNRWLVPRFHKILKHCLVYLILDRVCLMNLGKLVSLRGVSTQIQISSCVITVHSPTVSIRWIEWSLIWKKGSRGCSTKCLRRVFFIATRHARVRLVIVKLRGMCLVMVLVCLKVIYGCIWVILSKVILYPPCKNFSHISSLSSCTTTWFLGVRYWELSESNAIASLTFFKLCHVKISWLVIP